MADTRTTKYCHTGFHWVARKLFAPGASSCRGCLKKKRARARYAAGEGRERAKARATRDRQKAEWASVDTSARKLVYRVKRLVYDPNPRRVAWAQEALQVARAIKAVCDEQKPSKNVEDWTHWREVLRIEDFDLLDRALQLCQTYPSVWGDCPFIRRD